MLRGPQRRGRLAGSEVRDGGGPTECAGEERSEGRLIVLPDCHAGEAGAESCSQEREAETNPFLVDGGRGEIQHKGGGGQGGVLLPGGREAGASCCWSERTEPGAGSC